MPTPIADSSSSSEPVRREIGRTGLKVFPIGLGAMPLSIQGRPDAAQAGAVIKAFIDGGGDFIDTANAYCVDQRDMGHNEQLIRRTLDRLGVADRIMVATKGGLIRPRGEWEVDGRPAWLRASCEKSLRDLNTDCIALYQLHAVDPKVPLADSLAALLQLQAEGKIRHIGLSNVRPEQLREALAQAPIVSVQNRCSLFNQGDFRNGMVDLCADKGVSYIAHSPVGGHFGHARLAAHAELGALAARLGVSAYRVALAWLMQKGSHILPIPGASKVASIIDSLRSVAVSLSAADMAVVDSLPDL